MPEAVDLIVVETLLQMLNAVEYRQRVGWESPALLVLLGPPFSKRSFAPLHREMRWASVTHLFVHSQRDVDIGRRTVRERGFFLEQYWNWRRLCLRWRLDGYARRIGTVGTLVIGNYLKGHKDYIRHLTHVVPHRQLVLVDDGNDTLRVNDQRRKALTRGRLGRETERASSWKKRFKARWMELYAAEAPALTYFSVYDLELPRNDSLIKNDYRALRAQAARAVRSEEVYFLGQPLIGDGYLSAAAYRRALEEVQAHFHPEHLTYVPHPRESRDDLEPVSDLGMKTTRFERPIEYELIVSGRWPRRLAGFFCSALDSCAVIFGQELPITCFELPPAVLGKNRQEVAGFYATLRRRIGPQFAVVPLTSLSGPAPGARQI
jgi:hypothetical protein